HVQNEHGDEERRKASRPFAQQNFVLFLDGVQSADAGADEHTGFIAVQFVEVQSGVLQRLVAGVNAELREAVGAPDFLGRRKGGSRIKIFHFGRNLAIVLGDVERSDFINAAASGDEVVPEGVNVQAER